MSSMDNFDFAPEMAPNTSFDHTSLLSSEKLSSFDCHGSKVGAVGYLNMLPFFHEPQNTCWVADSPTSLNKSLSSNALLSACVSNISGQKQRLILAEPAMGIACLGAVQSVYLEPLFHSESDVHFWNQFVICNENAFQNSRPLPIRRSERPSKPEPVVLITSGASEQSLWLFRALLLWQGLESRVIRLDEADQLTQEEILNTLGGSPKSPLALLSIGDPALNRLSRFPGKTRLDLGSTWRGFSGLPCVFAAWYLNPLLSSLPIKLRTNNLREWAEAQAEIEVRLQSVLYWNDFNDSEKMQCIRRFQGLTPSAASEKSFALKYLKQINHIFGPKEKECLEAYRLLQTLFPEI